MANLLGKLVAKESVVPDLLSPIIGWRAWVVVEDSMLRSVAMQSVWPTEDYITGECRATDSLAWLNPHPELVPFELCTCGIYAKKTRAGVIKEYFEAWSRYGSKYLGPGEVLAVVGTVKLWGKVICHTDGYRAKHAYPDEITDVFASEGVGEKRVTEILDNLEWNYLIDNTYTLRVSPVCVFHRPDPPKPPEPARIFVPSLFNWAARKPYTVEEMVKQSEKKPEQAHEITLPASITMMPGLPLKGWVL